MSGLTSDDIIEMIVKRMEYNENKYLEYGRKWDIESCKEDCEDTKLDEYEELFNNYRYRYRELQQLYQDITRKID